MKQIDGEGTDPRELGVAPGPWFVGAQNDALYIIDKPPRPDNDYPNHGADVGVVAKIYRHGAHETEDAYARLMAAAPDLYAALKAVENLSRSYTNTHVEVPADEWQNAMRLVYAALAKVEARE